MPWFKEMVHSSDPSGAGLNEFGLSGHLYAPACGVGIGEWSWGELAPDGPPRCQIIIPGVDNNELTMIGKVMRIMCQLHV